MDKDQNVEAGVRRQWFSNGKKVELIGKIHCDVFNINRLLLNNVDIKIVFTRENESFFMWEPNTSTSSLKILEANIICDQAHVNPAIAIAHHETLKKGVTAKYPFKNNIVRHFVINAGSSSVNLDNLVIGTLPNMIVFGMVLNSAFGGTRSQNPFKFMHFGLESFSLYVNGQQVPSKALNFKFSDTEGTLSTQGYNTLFRGTGICHYNQGHQITKQLYDSNYFLLIYDLTADHSHNSPFTQVLRQGTVRIELEFSTPLTEAITCIVMSEFDSMLEIDHKKLCKLSF